MYIRYLNMYVMLYDCFQHFWKNTIASNLFLPRLLATLVKSTVSPPERCDIDGVKLEKVHEVFEVCRIGTKGVTLYNVPQYGLLHDQSLCTLLK